MRFNLLNIELKLSVRFEVKDVCMCYRMDVDLILCLLCKRWYFVELIIYADWRHCYDKEPKHFRLRENFEGTSDNFFKNYFLFNLNVLSM